jgi:WD40 repeat protein
VRFAWDCDSAFTLGSEKRAVSSIPVQDRARVQPWSLRGEEESGELWGCATSPKEDIFTTAGEDATLRVWDIATRQEVACAPLKARGISLSWNKNGQDLAVGLDNGTVQILSYHRGELDEMLSVKKRAKRIQCVAFSPCGAYLATGGADNLVDLFDTTTGYKYLGSCKGNNSVILHIDFSADSKYIQTCSQSYELLFYEVANQTQFVKSRDLRNQKWASFTSILGWDVQGIWPTESDGSDVNAVAKSKGEKYLASVEDTGLVKIFNYPCVGGGLDKKGQLTRRPYNHSQRGHSSHVTNVSWDRNDNYVISTGGADLCVFQWKVMSTSN